MDHMYVIETEDDIFLGRVQWVDGGVKIYTGFRGHPKLINREDVVCVTPARSHPAVEYIKAV